MWNQNRPCLRSFSYCLLFIRAIIISLFWLYNLGCQYKTFLVGWRRHLLTPSTRLSNHIPALKYRKWNWPWATFQLDFNTKQSNLNTIHRYDLFTWLSDLLLICFYTNYNTIIVRMKKKWYFKLLGYTVNGILQYTYHFSLFIKHL